MLSPNTGWEMMNDYVKHIISLLHHHCNTTAKFHSSYPISSLFKERKLLVPVIRYVARLCARVKPTLPLGFLLCSGCSQIHTHRQTHTYTSRQIHMFHVSDPPQFSHPLFTHFKDYYLALVYSLRRHPLVFLKWFRDLQAGTSSAHTLLCFSTHKDLHKCSSHPPSNNNIIFGKELKSHKNANFFFLSFYLRLSSSKKSEVMAKILLALIFSFSVFLFLYPRS